MRNVALGPLLASELRAAGTHYSDDQVNSDARGCHVTVNVTEINADNEIQTITVDAAGGTFTVTFDAEETAALDFDILAADLQTALEGLSTIGAGNVSVSGGPGDAGGTTPYVVEFIGDLAGANQAAMTTDATNLTGGAGTAVVATTQAGGGNGSSLVVTIQGKDPISGEYYDLLVDAAVASVAASQLKVYPGITVAANVSVSDVLPPFWRVKAVLTGGDCKFSVGASLVM